MTSLNAKYSNTKVKSRNENITEIFASNYAGVSMSAPNGFHGLDNPSSSFYVSNGGTVPDDRNFVCDIPFIGTDTETGYGPPTGSPMYATDLYGAYVIDWYNGFVTSDKAGVDSICPITFKDVIVEGHATKALSIKFLAVADATYNHATHTGGYRQQAWGTIRRNLITGSDFESFGFNCFVWINSLTGKHDATHARTTIVDMKTGNLTGGGALRYLLTIIRSDVTNPGDNITDAALYGVASGIYGWEVIIDNNANDLGAIVREEFTRFKNYTVPVPEEEWFELDFSFKKSSSYSDLTGGRFIVRMRPGNSPVWSTIADIYSTTVAAYEALYPLRAIDPVGGTRQAQRNIHHSIRDPGSEYDDILHRIFFGQYSKRKNTDFEIMFAKPRFYSGIRDL